jgi:hypothetical protein
MSWKLHQMDVKETFLNGDIEEQVYIKQLEGFMIYKQEISCVQDEESPIWTKEDTSCLVREDGWIIDELGF